MGFSKEYLKDLKKWNQLGDNEWVATHVQRFEPDIRKNYLDYEDFLNEVLKEACRKLAPLAIIEHGLIPSIQAFDVPARTPFKCPILQLEGGVSVAIGRTLSGQGPDRTA